MDVSVIICTWNNCERLTITLDVISHCIVPSDLTWELVLVNNNSVDETKNITTDYSSKLPLVYTEEPQQGLSRARNKGIKVATGNLIVFTDDDTKPCPEWIEVYWNAYMDKPSGFFFGGPIRSEFEIENPNSEFLRSAPQSITGLDWGPKAKELTSEQVLLGANWACPAKALKAAGGFDEQLGLDASLGVRRIGEEVEFMLRLRELGMSAWYLPQACVVHFVPERNCSLSYIGSNAEAHGFYYSIVGIPSNFLYGRPVLKSSLGEGPGTQVAVFPFKFFKYFLSVGSRFLWRRLCKKKSYEEYVLLRFFIGMMRGYRQNRKLL